MFVLDNFPSLWDTIKNTQKPIYLYGMGNGAEKLIQVLKGMGVSVSGVFASDEFVRGQTFLDFPVKRYGDVVNQHKEVLVLLSFGTSRLEVLERIDAINREQELYVPDLPVVGEGLYDQQFFITNENSLCEVLNMLDEHSKEPYMDVLKYKKTGEIKYLSQNGLEPEMQKYETIFDCGAYDGDTVLNFAETNYRHIFALEPDPKNFQKLVNKTSHLQNITYFNMAAHSHSAEVPFSATANRNSNICAANASRQVRADSIDNLLAGREVTFIKLDVEGNEENVIYGLRETIQKYKPKLKISAYHRTEDIYKIPLLVKNIRDDYHIRFFKETYLPPWDSYFYFY